MGIRVGNVTSEDRADLVSALALAQDIYESRFTKTQKRLDEATSELGNAERIFRDKIIVSGDATALKSLIDDAIQKLNETTIGTHIGEVSQEDYTTFSLAISAAEEEYEHRVLKTQNELDFVSLTLDHALTSFISQIIEHSQSPQYITGTVKTPTSLEFTFSEDATWRGQLTGVYMDGNSAPIHSSRVNRLATGKITVDTTGMNLNPGNHIFVFKAEGYTDATVIVTISWPNTSPSIAGVMKSPTSLEFTFTDDAAWRGELTGVYMDGDSAPIHSSRVNRLATGKITVDTTGMNLTAGDHVFVLKAEGYMDVTVTVNVSEPKTSPSMVGVVTSPTNLDFTFTEDATWRGQLTGVYMDGDSASIHSSRVNRLASGKITVDTTGMNLTLGDHVFVFKAEGYTDATVTVTISGSKTSPSIVGAVNSPTSLEFMFTDDATWRGQLKGVYMDGNSAPIHSSRVNRLTAGKITVDITGMSLSTGVHSFMFMAEGYNEVVVLVVI